MSLDGLMSEKWQYGMPFYYFGNHRFCYLWVHKKYKMPYLGIVDGKLVNDPDLLSEKRSRMKILLIDPTKKIPVKKIEALLQKLMKIYSEQSL